MCRSVLLLLVFLFPTFLSAEDGSSSPTKVDYAFLLICSAMIFFMQAGFCLLETGISRSKNAINISMKNAIDFVMGMLAFMLVGFGLMFGDSVVEGFFAWKTVVSKPADSPVWIFWLFQSVFAATAVTIVSGAVAERTKFVGYVVFAFIAVAFIYPVLGHWVWGGAAGNYDFGTSKGWLAAKGFQDFAGGTVVHGVGGAFALAGIIVVGPRLGRFAKDGTARLFSGHNLPLVTLGIFVLWFGWFGFNAGSNLTPDVSIGRIAANTMVCSASAMASAMLFFRVKNGYVDVVETLNGALCGLVAITACCNVVSPISAIIIGFIAGGMGVFSGALLLKLRLDDAVGAVPVHLVNGIFGTLCVSIFNENGYFKDLGIQALGAFIVPGVAFMIAFFVFKIIDLTIGVRASDDHQREGLDFAEHAANAYPDFVVNENELEEE